MFNSFRIECQYHQGHLLQIRSHAQKYFLKVQKSGTSDHLPPPRPKRKAAHPYPQKSSNNGQQTLFTVNLFFKHQFCASCSYMSYVAVPVILQVSGSFQTPSTFLEPGIVLRPDSSSMLRGPITGPAVSSWTNNGMQTINILHSTEGLLLTVLDSTISI